MLATVWQHLVEAGLLPTPCPKPSQLEQRVGGSVFGGQQSRDLGRRPAVTTCRGPNAARFQFSGDGKVVCALGDTYRVPDVQ
jgi:hypothetical protein